MDTQVVKRVESDNENKPLFLDFVVEIPEDVELSKSDQFAESIRYDGKEAKSVDD